MNKLGVWELKGALFKLHSRCLSLLGETHYVGMMLLSIVQWRQEKNKKVGNWSVIANVLFSYKILRVCDSFTLVMSLYTFKKLYIFKRTYILMLIFFK